MHSEKITHKNMSDRVQTSAPNNRGFSRNTTTPFNRIKKIMRFRETLNTNKKSIISSYVYVLDCESSSVQVIDPDALFIQGNLISIP